MIPKIAIFAHDAGGSELVLELLLASLDLGTFRLFCLNNSPCQVLAEKKHLQLYMQFTTGEKEQVFSLLDDYQPELILYTTGWQNHYEYHFLAYAKTHNLPAVAFLDNWTNYRERFGFPEKNWKKNLPNFIAVHDEQSQKIAQELGFKNIVAIKNYALLRQIQQYKKLSIQEKNRLLFLSEPTAQVAQKIYGDSGYWGFDETDIFREVLQKKALFGCDDVIVRLHPSDSSKKYKEILKECIISDKTLEEDIARAKIVIGIDSSALYFSFLMGKKTLAYIPSDRRDFCVPLPQNNRMRILQNSTKLVINKKNPQNFGMDFALFLQKILKEYIK